MSRRAYFLAFFVICFFIALYVGSNVYQDWARFSVWDTATVALNIIFGFGVILVVYWAYVDDEHLKELERKTKDIPLQRPQAPETETGEPTDERADELRRKGYVYNEAMGRWEKPNRDLTKGAEEKKE